VSVAATRREPGSDRGWWLLLVLEVVVAANAVGGGICGLSGAEGVPLEWLAIEMLIIPLSWLQPMFLIVALAVILLGFRARARARAHAT